MDAIFFWVLAAVTVVASLLVVGQRSPMYSVLLLIVSFGGLSGLYVLLGSPFVAVVQIIIYAGAIMVLFLFVVMLLNVPREESSDPGVPHGRTGSGPRRFGAVLSVVLVVELVVAVQQMATPAGVDRPASTVHEIGLRLFREYAFAFEVTSVLILVAMVGAVVLARREVRE